jgi:predicted Rossmann fold flavoprotein
MKVAIIGGGAAGFFSAIQVKENYPESEVTIFEKTTKVLSKVKISGGGRCNLTNGCTEIEQLAKAYPRGERFLKRAFYSFNTKDAYQWFENRGIPLVIQDDNCVFPKSQNSQTIINLFLEESKRLQIFIKLEKEVIKIESINSQLRLFFEKVNNPQVFDKVIVTTGGSPKRINLSWLEDLNHQIESPVPSLFTFNMPDERITKLMGLVVQNTIVGIQGSKFLSKGPLLITHWGMSGPAIIVLSSYAARLLSEKDYHFKIQVNWINEKNHQNIYHALERIITQFSNKKIKSIKAYSLPERLWLYLLEKAEISPEKKWKELGNKAINRLIQILSNDVYVIKGKTTFKEEFVTCGGISLKSINQKTMESKQVPNLYFAGEVLDIDGITGGFNFQAAWTTAFIAARLYK